MNVHLRLSCLALAFTMTATATAAVISGPVINPANGNSYYLLSSSTWSDSQTQALALGGNLATINDAAEDAWVFDTFATPSRMLWIGLNDIATEGSFSWVSGEPITFTHWSAGEPQGGLNENWVAIRTQASGPQREWIDWRNEGSFFGVPVHGVVEVVVPEPHFVGLLLAASAIGALRTRDRRRPR